MNMRLRSPIGRDRRRWKRHWFNGTIQLSHASRNIEWLGIQLSAGGMYLFAMADLPVGCEIRLAFTAPGSKEHIELAATVRHRAVYLYGVEFLGQEHTAVPPASAKIAQKHSSLPSQ